MIKACGALVALNPNFNIYYAAHMQFIVQSWMFKYSIFSAPGDIIGYFYHF